jgi:hypothetical protein
VTSDHAVEPFRRPLTEQSTIVVAGTVHSIEWRQGSEIGRGLSSGSIQKSRGLHSEFMDSANLQIAEFGSPLNGVVNILPTQYLRMVR